ncbi:FapA family protein [Saccharibacillus deserti]|uniref:FapA family protein n=1 Tax=Saccharibacillus deserti TaxID=1634444 RepID=UPI001551AC6A|nr:FapA family protein [Saccharibacillus deserti]
MGRNVVTKGKTVNEAIRLALELLGTQKENVNIEILDSGSKGVFGLAAKPSTVRVTLNAAPASVPFEPVMSLDKLVSLTLDLNDGSETLPHSSRSEEVALSPIQMQHEGKVWVEGGVVHICSTPERYPLIGPVQHAKVLKNGVVLEMQEPVSEHDRIVVEPELEYVEPEWELVTDETQMSLMLHVKPGYRVHRFLQDMAPCYQAEFKFSEVRLPVEIQLDEVMSALKEKNITFGIKQDVIVEACRSVVPSVFRIAEGLVPVPGSHGRFQTPIEKETQHAFPRKREDGTVDYREIREFPTASEGQILGVIVPPVPGVPGINIKGESVEAPPVYPIVPMKGEGTAWTDDDSRSVALRSGMPQIRQQGYQVKVSIIPKLMHGGDVDLSSGNIHFQGDVEIGGSVQDGMKVDTSGSILVRGNVNMANIVASQSLIVQANIISSKITVGKSNMLYAEIEPLLKEVSSKLVLLKSAIYQVSHAAAFKMTDFQSSGLGPLLNVLLKGKFKYLNDTFTQLFEKIESNQSYLDEEWGKYSKELYRKLLNPLTDLLLDLNDLDQFKQQTDYLYALVEPPIENHVFAKFDYAHNSHIYSGGDIVIGKGCYGGMIYCQGHMESQGFLRGGVYYAGKGMRVNEVGSRGASTKLHVPEYSEIQAARAFEGTILQVGKRFYQLPAEKRHIHARLNADGELIIH